MKRLWLAGFALAALAADPAAAADLTKPVYKAPPVAVFSWTGFYAGANVGYSWGRSSNDWNFFAQSVGGAPPAATTCAPVVAAFFKTGSDSNKLNGAIGGFQAGYNWQRANYLIGVETDIQVSGQKGDQIFITTNATSGTFNGVPLVGTVTTAYTEKLTWLGTLRGRVGFGADRWLLYATGGLAYGRVTINGSSTAVGSNAGPGCVPQVVIGFTCPLASFSNSVTKAGWTIGAGAEGSITGNWSWKVEYLHVDLGKVSTAFATFPGCYGGILIIGGGGAANCTPYLAGSGTISSRITDEIVRVGINYRFDPGPVVANY